MAQRLFFVRHCETTGQSPTAPLTPAGHQQALELADHFAPQGVDLLVSSPYTRAQQSIAPLAERLGLAVQTDERLAECTLASPPVDDFRGAIRQLFDDPDLAWPGGESRRQVTERGRSALDAVFSHSARTPVVVAHGLLMTCVLRSFDARFDYQAWAALTNPDVYCLEMEANGVRVSRAWGA
ncbi:MAG: hypothetical protein ETSY1_04150 [Candidatus Entotheonella factor]|uniref:Phosphoglycerate mutase n=1 Tax=Entotheonella factor TaxID=1429438 RepID=W4LWN4_ENTF1|nr:histidine phosphatase family protein [Candidatus Entotheonella palauensis]ETX02288.1 MAG: hypothetical protein ETSY1_04150 [Candidatus Entotheonella factor]